MGRKKLPDRNYFEETTDYHIRLRKEVLEAFLAAYGREKARRKLTQKKGYFVNGVISELMIKYVEAVKAKELYWEKKVPAVVPNGEKNENNTQ